MHKMLFMHNNRYLTGLLTDVSKPVKYLLLTHYVLI